MNNQAQATHTLVLMQQPAGSLLCQALAQSAHIRTLQVVDITADSLISAARFSPDVIVVDADEGESAVTAACVALRDTLPDVPILLLSWYDDADTTRLQARCGATGHVLKELDSRPLQTAVIAQRQGALQPGITAL